MANKAETKDRYSCENIQLIQIDLDHVILLLRVMDVLINNLTKEVVQWDFKDNFKKKENVTILTTYRPQLDHVKYHLMSGRKPL